MLRGFRLAALFVVISAFDTELSAQMPGMSPAAEVAGEVAGKIVTTAGLPVSVASIAVRSLQDSVLVNGAMSAPDGTFRIAGIRAGRYKLVIRAIGFSPLERQVMIDRDTPRVLLNSVALTAVATVLEKTTVMAQADKAVLAADRNSYNVKDMPAASGGTAVDVLRTVPGVEVDGDSRLSLRGNQNVVVQINGRTSPLRGEQLGGFLSQVSSNMVQRVEVVANPSAKEDPEGVAGILNIVLKQKTDAGTSAGLMLATGSTSSMSGSGNAGLQQGALTLFGTYGYSSDERRISGYTNRRNLYVTPNTYLNAENTGLMQPRGHNVMATAEYKPGETDLLSTNFTFNNRNVDRQFGNLYTEQDADGDILSLYDRSSRGPVNHSLLDWSSAFKRTVKPKLNESSLELRFNQFTRNVVSRFLNEQLDPDGSPSSAQPERLSDDLDETLTEITAQADATRPVPWGGTIDFGYKGARRSVGSLYESAEFSYASGVFMPDIGRSNSFDYSDQVHAVYALVNRATGKLKAQAGLRAEMVTSTFDLKTTGESFENDYRSVYPSALVSYDATPARQLKLSYAKRVQRPHTQMLNPFVFREDVLNTQQGNPYLKPAYTHSFELGFQESFGKGSLQVTPYFRTTVDAMRSLRAVNADGVSELTFANVESVRSLGADATASYRVGGFNGFAGINVFRTELDASNLSTDVSTESFVWSVRSNASYRISPSLDAQLFVMYRAPMNTAEGRILSQSMTTVSLRKKLMAEKGSVTLRLQDPFNKAGFGFEQSDARVIQRSERRFGQRGVYLTFSYNYGKAPKLRAKPVESTESPDQTPSGN